MFEREQSTLLLTHPKGRGAGGGGGTRLGSGGANSSTSLKTAGSGLRRSVVVVDDRIDVPQIAELGEVEGGAETTPVTSTLRCEGWIWVE